MIYRDIYNTLVTWAKDLSRRPLLLRGARQVGKSFIVEYFGRTEFANIISINFERNPEYKTIFSSFDPKILIEKIELISGHKIIPGKSLLFFDEIQECPKAITSLRYFFEEIPSLHIIGAGSLLEFALKSKNFKMPVGRIQYLYMQQLNFLEFLDALDEKQLRIYISSFENIKNIESALHDKLNELLRKYFVLGGMPAVISEYLQSGDMIKCQKIQRSILDTYFDDFGKYTNGTNPINIQKVFYAATKMIGQKFKYSSVDNTVRSRELKEAVILLENAGIIKKIRRTNGEGLPLEANVKDNFFKILFLDVGLLHNATGIYGETTLANDFNSIFKGAVAEQFVGQELISVQSNFTKPKLYYWAREARNSNAEIDYLIEKEGAIIPIEVKSGHSGKMKSLKLFMNQFNSKLALKFSQNNYSELNGIISVPFYGIDSFFKD